MKIVLRNFIALMIVITSISVNAQQMRYLDDVFTNVTVISDVQYAENISILPAVLSGGVNPPALSPILCDIYHPTGDSLTDRPVVVVAHTGSFLPPVVNGQPTGNKLDSSIVHNCMRWAQKGYVAIAMNYRLGWNPTSTDQDTRTSTLLQAAYRGVQDCRSLVRFLRKSVAVDGNPYGIDHNKIAIGGQGTGGYLSLAAATLDTVGDTSPWQEIYLTKFFNLSTMQPYVYPPFFGNYDGTDSAGVPVVDSTTGTVIGTAWMNIPNNPTYSSDFNFAFNIGGCLADSSWLEQGDMPIVSFHCAKDENGPYSNGDVIVPTTGQFVVEAQGSYIVQKHQEMYGNNSVFANAGISDPITSQSVINNTKYDTIYNSYPVGNNYEGLYTFVTPPPSTTPNAFGQLATEEGSPWDWWDNVWYDQMFMAVNPTLPNGTATPPGFGAANSLLGGSMSPAKGNAYLDTIHGYLNPRMFLALGLDTITSSTTSIEDIIDFATEIYPNPSADRVNIISYAAKINNIEIYNIHGQIVFNKLVNSTAVKINTNILSSGTYILRINSDVTTISRKLIIE